MVVDHTRCAINNPLPIVAGVALVSVGLPAALSMLFIDLAANHEERIDDLREFCKLVRENKPKGLAKATVLLGELYLLHKTMQAFRPEIQTAVTRCNETFAKLGSCASEELEFALATESAGGVQPATPLGNMLKKAAETVEQAEIHGIEAVKDSLHKRAGSKVTSVPLEQNPTTLKNFLKSTTESVGNKPQAPVAEYTKYADTSTLFEDFKCFFPSEVIESTTKDGGLLKIGKLSDGRTIVARATSKTGSPTLEFQENINGKMYYIKVRYLS